MKIPNFWSLTECNKKREALEIQVANLETQVAKYHAMLKLAGESYSAYGLMLYRNDDPNRINECAYLALGALQMAHNVEAVTETQFRAERDWLAQVANAQIKKFGLPGYMSFTPETIEVPTAAELQSESYSR